MTVLPKLRRFIRGKGGFGLKNRRYVLILSDVSKGFVPTRASRSFKIRRFSWKGMGAGGRGNFFSREKKLFPFPRNDRPLSETEPRIKELS